MPSKIIWPWWVRLSHWLVASGVALLWVLAYVYYETDAFHRWLGYAVLTLVLWRIVAAKLTQLPSAKLYFPGWRELALHISHIKKLQLAPADGHNPLGQIAVYVIWTLIALLALTGWLSRTDKFWGEDWPVDLHAGLSWLLMFMVFIHVLAVFLVGRISRQHLILQMLHGKRHLIKK